MSRDIDMQAKLEQSRESRGPAPALFAYGVVCRIMLQPAAGPYREQLNIMKHG